MEWERARMNRIILCRFLLANTRNNVVHAVIYRLGRRTSPVVWRYVLYYIGTLLFIRRKRDKMSIKHLPICPWRQTAIARVGVPPKWMLLYLYVYNIIYHIYMGTEYT